MNLNNQILNANNRKIKDNKKAELKEIKSSFLRNVKGNFLDYIEHRQRAQMSYSNDSKQNNELETEIEKYNARFNEQENKTYRFFGNVLNQLTDKMKATNLNDMYCVWQISSKAENGLIESVFLPSGINISLLQFLCDANGIIFSTSFDGNEANMYFEVSAKTEISPLEREELAIKNLENMLNYHRSIQLENVLGQGEKTR